MVSLKGLEAALAESRDDPSQRPDEIVALAGLAARALHLRQPGDQRHHPGRPGGGLEGRRPRQRRRRNHRPPRAIVGRSAGGPPQRHGRGQRGPDLLDRSDQRGTRPVAAFVKTQSVFSPEVTANMERELGMQQITIRGPRHEPLRGVMLAADYRMKRLAMAFDKSSQSPPCPRI